MSCKGDCCVAFRVPYTPEELAHGDVGSQDADEARVMADMLVPLTVEQGNQRRLDLIEGVVPTFDSDDEGHVYMCSKWDEETRLCTDYENRPAMCRTFPYAKPCRYGCSCVGEAPGPEVII